MLDIGWTELAIVALIALLVIGPKELPKAMKTVAGWVSRLRGLAREFQAGVDEMVREAELDEVKTQFDRMADSDLDGMVENTIDPSGSVNESLNLDPDFTPPDETPPERAPKKKAASGTAKTRAKGASAPASSKGKGKAATGTGRNTSAKTTSPKAAGAPEPAGSSKAASARSASRSPKAKSGAGA